MPGTVLAHIRSGHHIEGQFQVTRITCQQRRDSHCRCSIRKRCTRKRPTAWQCCLTWLVSIDPTKSRRNTSGASNIAPQFQRSQASCERCRSSSSAPSWCIGKVPWIIRATIDWIGGLPIRQKRRYIRLPHNDRPGSTQALNGTCILLRAILCKQLRSRCSRQPYYINRLLDR